MPEDRQGLIAALTEQLSHAADSVPGDWDGFSMVAELTALGVRVTGFRYLGAAPGIPLLMDSDVIETVAELRQASPGMNGELFDVFVARLDRSSGELVGNAFNAADGARFKVTAARVAAVAQMIRPDADLSPIATPSLPQADPAMPDQPEAPEAAPEPAEPDTRAGLDAAVTGWPELAGDDWDYYAAAARFTDDGTHAVGFRYLGPGPAVPTQVGGDFLSELVGLRAAEPDADGRLAAAALLRMSRGERLQVRLIHDPAVAAQIDWHGGSLVAVADNLRPRHQPDSPPPGLAERPDGATLDDESLLERISSDVAASLRGVDQWDSYALAVDVVRNRAASFLYQGDHDPRRFPPDLSPLPDLSALHRVTAGQTPDWSGVRITAWAGSDRVDVTVLDEAGVEALLGQGPGPAADLLRPPAEPPDAVPARPQWSPAPAPAPDRNAAFSAVAAAVTSAPELATLDWDRFAVVIDMTGAQPRLTGLRWYGYGPATPTAIPDAGPVAELQAATPDGEGRLWRVAILRGVRATRQLRTEFRYGADADPLLGPPDAIMARGEELRPG